MSRAGKGAAAAAVVAVLASLGGCAGPSEPAAAARPSVAPATRPAGTLELGDRRAAPMHRELLAVDLPTVVRVARSQSIDVRQARLRVEAAAGRYESSVGAIFPAFSPGASFEHIEGSVRGIEGPLLAADFTSFTTAALVQWVLNPGRVVYDVVAARRRLEASENQERHVVQETTRAAAVQYYDLVLAQARLAVAQRSVSESEELLRITRLRQQAGTGLEADRLRAEADLARRRQDLALALNAFYEASVALAVTLRLDPTVTLVPRPNELPQVALVSDELDIDRLLSLAVQWREDLRGVRTLIAAVAADRTGIGWGGLGPQVQVGYQYGGISSDTPDRNFGLREQRRLSASAGWSFSLATLGQLKTAGALEKQAALEAERQLDLVRAQVVRASQASATNAALVPMAKQQLAATEEALRLAQANLRAGTMLTVDVLQAEDAADEARVRYAAAVVRYNQSQVNLLAALGLIDEATLTGRAGEDGTDRPAATQSSAAWPNPAAR